MDKLILQKSDALQFTVIRRQYSRMPVKEIADLIDREPAFVQDFIDKYLAGTGLLNYEETIELREKEAVKAQKERKLKAANAALSKKKVIVSKNGKPVKPRREDDRLPTKQVDYSQLHSLRIDSKTIIYLQPGEDEAKAKLRYQKAVERTRSAGIKKIDPETESKVCSRCKKRKLYEKFSKYPNNADGYREVCKECSNQETKLHIINKKEARSNKYLIQ